MIGETQRNNSETIKCNLKRANLSWEILFKWNHEMNG